MYALWHQAYPHTTFTEQRIADQALSLLRRKAFTEIELDNIRRGATGGGQVGEETLVAATQQTRLSLIKVSGSPPCF